LCNIGSSYRWNDKKLSWAPFWAKSWWKNKSGRITDGSFDPYPCFQHLIWTHQLSTGGCLVYEYHSVDFITLKGLGVERYIYMRVASLLVPVNKKHDFKKWKACFSLGAGFFFWFWPCPAVSSGNEVMVWQSWQTKRRWKWKKLCLLWLWLCFFPLVQV